MKPNSQVKAQSAQKQFDEVDISMYTSQTPSNKSETSTSKSTGFDFGSLSSTPSSSVINFHALKKENANFKEIQNSSSVYEPSSKRRKLKVKPAGFIEEFSSNQLNLSPISISPPTQKTKPTQFDETDKKEQGKRYIIEVKYNRYCG